jgi:hypothetical protein
MGFRTQKKSEQIRDGNVREVDIDFGLNQGQVNANSNPTNTTNFDNNLSSLDDTVQKALDTLDDIDLESIIEAETFKLAYDEFDFGTSDSGSIGTWGWVQYNITGLMRIDYVDPYDRIGVIRLTTSKGTNKGGTISTSAANTLYSHGNLRFRTSIRTGSTIAAYVCNVGLHDQKTGYSDPKNGIYFKFDDSVSPYWQIVVVDNNNRTTITTSVSVAADQWYKLEALVNDTNDAVDFYIDDVHVGQNTGALPKTHGRYFSPAVSVLTRSQQSKTIEIDYYSIKYPILDR